MVNMFNKGQLIKILKHHKNVFWSDMYSILVLFPIVYSIPGLLFIMCFSLQGSDRFI